jgi:hypothetical protein
MMPRERASVVVDVAKLVAFVVVAFAVALTVIGVVALARAVLTVSVYAARELLTWQAIYIGSGATLLCAVLVVVIEAIQYARLARRSEIRR